jgi:RNA 2',3'-cyclic 3'-phosphodiesterase
LAEIRSFLAVDPPKEAVAELVREAEKLRRPVEQAGLRVAWVRPESLHITLKFFGNIAEEAIGAIAGALLGLQFPLTPVSAAVRLCGLSVFPSPRRPRVIFAGVERPEGLIGLQRSVEELLVPLGHEPEDRPFSPHLTLGRVRDARRGASIEDLLAAYQDRCFGPETAVSEIVLYESRQGRTGMDYIARARVGVAT